MDIVVSVIPVIRISGQQNGEKSEPKPEISDLLLKIKWPADMIKYWVNAMCLAECVRESIVVVFGSSLIKLSVRP